MKPEWELGSNPILLSLSFLARNQRGLDRRRDGVLFESHCRPREGRKADLTTYNHLLPFLKHMGRRRTAEDYHLMAEKNG